MKSHKSKSVLSLLAITIVGLIPGHPTILTKQDVPTIIPRQQLRLNKDDDITTLWSAGQIFFSNIVTTISGGRITPVKLTGKLRFQSNPMPIQLMHADGSIEHQILNEL